MYEDAPNELLLGQVAVLSGILSGLECNRKPCLLRLCNVDVLCDPRKAPGVLYAQSCRLHYRLLAGDAWAVGTSSGQGVHYHSVVDCLAGTNM